MTRTRPAYTPAQLTAFMDRARTGRPRRPEETAAMNRHPAGNPRGHGVRTLSGPMPIPRDLPALTNADSTPAEHLPTTEADNR